jgi:DNA polymerase-3 subunit alpha
MSGFSHLHVRSHYSLLSALPKIPDLVRAAKEAGMPALALTDTGNLYGAIEFYKECTKQGLKPIIGVELTVARQANAKPDELHRLVLLCENNEGYRNLLKLVSAVHLAHDAGHYAPRELLKKYATGLLAIIPARDGELSARAGDPESVRETVAWYRETYGHNGVFAELTMHPEIPEHEERMRAAAEAAAREKLPLVAAHEIAYLSPEDRRAREIMLRIKDGTNAEDSAAGFDLSFKTPAEMEERFRDTPEALRNTADIAERCTVALTLGSWVFPEVPIPAGSTYDTELKKAAYQGLSTRGLAETPEVTARLEYELKVIADKGFSPYFLAVADLLNHAREQGILTTTRGSAGGSLVSYLTGITTIDPLAYKLPFERFLNPERPKAPDIDMDYADNRRDEMIEYAKQRYGQDRVAQIGTFGTMMARAAVRDVARALGHPYGLGDRIAKLIPMGSQGFPMTIDHALEREPDLKRLSETDEDVAEIIGLAKKIEGCARHISVHAAGVVVAPSPLTDWTPLERDPKGGKVITQYDMYSISDEYGGVGLLKFDFLGIRNLSILADAVARVKERRGIAIDIENVPLDDAKTFGMLARGETEATFQLNGAGMTRFLKELKPSSIHDINAMVALYRPGPMESIPQYIERKHNPRLVSYFDPRMEKILKESYGLLVYQEDVLLTAITLGGYSWLEADTLRKAMGKKVPAEMEAQKEKFIKGCVAYGKLTKERVERIWKLIEPFAAYGFGKAHAASYGKVAYQTAYMKANYPAEYMAAVLTAEAGDVDTIAVMAAECRRLGIEVLPPDINESFEDFTVVDKDGADAIRFGLKSIKNFGENVGHAIIGERSRAGRFSSVSDFLARIGAELLNRRSLESLIKCGAFDSFGVNRSALVGNIEKLLAYAKDAGTHAGGAQHSLFGTSAAAEVILEPAPALSRKDMLASEKELLGMYVSGHPLDQYQEILAKRRDTIKSLKERPVGLTVAVVGIIEEAKPYLTKSGEKMMFLKIADLTDSIEGVAFPKTYAANKEAFVPDTCVALEGKFAQRNGALNMLVERAKVLS